MRKNIQEISIRRSFFLFSLDRTGYQMYSKEGSIGSSRENWTISWRTIILKDTIIKTSFQKFSVSQSSHYPFEGVAHQWLLPAQGNMD